MGTEYYAIFGPLHRTREDVVDPLSAILHDMQAAIETVYDPLVRSGDELTYNFQREKCSSLADAVRSSQQWAGLEFHFVYRHFGCSFVIWNDAPESTTVAFCEPGALFEEQLDNTDTRNELGRLLIRFMQLLDAPVCVLEAEAEYVTPRTSDVQNWLSQLADTKSQKWRLVMARKASIPHTSIPPAARHAHHFLPVQSIDGWLLSLMGPIEITPD